MRAYIVTSGLLFALICAAHVARFVVEGSHVGRDPAFVLTSLIAVGMTAWAARLAWPRR
jgi:hypothetical protein